MGSAALLLLKVALLCKIQGNTHPLNISNMLRYLLVGLVLGGQVFGLPTDTSPTLPSTTTPSSKPKLTCDSQKDCKPCIESGCVFVNYPETSQECMLESDIVVDSVKPQVFHKTEDCPGSGDDPTPTPPPDTTSAPDTTTSDADTTTTTVTSTTTTTTVTTSTEIPDTTTTTVTTTTTIPTTTTTTTTTPVPITTSTAAPEPATGKGHFDGWSFFGGILLTLGLAAIGLVGYKYYRLRSGTGGNYNRF